jgi:coenzyme F420-reducing hydrogenase alpha subunit
MNFQRSIIFHRPIFPSFLILGGNRRHISKNDRGVLENKAFKFLNKNQAYLDDHLLEQLPMLGYIRFQQA